MPILDNKWRRQKNNKGGGMWKKVNIYIFEGYDKQNSL